MNAKGTVLFILAALSPMAPSGCATGDDAQPLSLTARVDEADKDSLPDADIFLATLSFSKAGLQIGAPVNITDHPGYDNQPSFLPGENAFYFVSEGMTGKTDIWRYDIATSVKTRIHETSMMSEFSPQTAPGGYGLSYIQEGPDGEVTRVHAASASGGSGAPVIDLASLGYYAWLDGAKALGVYKRSEPATLYLVDVESGGAILLYENIGRCLMSGPGGRSLYFTGVQADGAQLLMRYSLASGSIEAVTTLIDEAQDYRVIFDKAGAARGVFTASGPVVYYQPLGRSGGGWRPAADFAALGLGDITRIAVSDNQQWIAFVAQAH